jgi:hypothetical protein
MSIDQKEKPSITTATRIVHPGVMSYQIMVRRTCHKNDSCPVARTLDALGDGWSLLIMRDARYGEWRALAQGKVLANEITV